MYVDNLDDIKKKLNCPFNFILNFQDFKLIIQSITYSPRELVWVSIVALYSTQVPIVWSGTVLEIGKRAELLCV